MLFAADSVANLASVELVKELNLVTIFVAPLTVKSSLSVGLKFIPKLEFIVLSVDTGLPPPVLF